jgi:hypothetical protein
MTEAKEEYGLRSQWKCMLACILVSMAPFQYGVDFGLIGPLQAMIGFLKVILISIPKIPMATEYLTINRSSAIQTHPRPSAGTSIPVSNSSFPPS